MHAYDPNVLCSVRHGCCRVALKSRKMSRNTSVFTECDRRPVTRPSSSWPASSAPSPSIRDARVPPRTSPPSSPSTGRRDVTLRPRRPPSREASATPPSAALWPAATPAPPCPHTAARACPPPVPAPLERGGGCRGAMAVGRGCCAGLGQRRAAATLAGPGWARQDENSAGEHRVLTDPVLMERLCGSRCFRTCCLATVATSRRPGHRIGATDRPCDLEVLKAERCGWLKAP